MCVCVFRRDVDKLELALEKNASAHSSEMATLERQLAEERQRLAAATKHLQQLQTQLEQVKTVLRKYLVTIATGIRFVCATLTVCFYWYPGANGRRAGDTAGHQGRCGGVDCRADAAVDRSRTNCTGQHQDEA